MKTKILLTFFCLCSMTHAISQTLSESEVVALMNRAVELNGNKRYKEALDALLAVGANTEQQRDENERQVYVISQTMACSCYGNIGEYEKGYLLARKLLQGNLTESEKNSIYPSYALYGYRVAYGILTEGNADVLGFQKARSLLVEVAPYANKQLLERILPIIPYTWYNEGRELYLLFRFNEAMECFKNAQKLYNEQGNTKDEIFAIRQIASIKDIRHDRAGAIAAYRQALSLSQQTNDIEGMMEFAGNLYELSMANGDVAEIEKYSNLVDSIGACANDIHLQFNNYLQKGKSEYRTRRYCFAELWYMKCKEIAESQSDITFANLRLMTYSNLRDLYTATGQLDKALKYAEMGIEEEKRCNSDIEKEFSFNYLFIADIYCRKGDRENCFKYIDSLFMAEGSIQAPEQQALMYTTRGSCHKNFKEYGQALADYKKADKILAAEYDVTDINRAFEYPIIGGILYNLGNFCESEHYYSLYAQSVGQSYGEQSMEYFKALIYLANIQGYAGKTEEGFALYTKAAGGMKDLVRRRVPYLNTAEREGFWVNVHPLFTNMTAYALEAGFLRTAHTQECYDALLITKAFLLDTERSLYGIVSNEGDSADKETYLSIAAMNSKVNELAKDYRRNADEILALSNSINRQESRLAGKFESFGEITSFMEIDYDTVRNALKGSDVLIDFTDFVKESSGRQYAAFIISNKQEFPMLKHLFAESQIDSLGIVRPDQFYSERFSKKVVELLWEPLKEHAEEGATVYYVPSQLFFGISLESLPLEDGTLLGEHYNFVRLSSARELVKEPVAEEQRPSIKSAALYGGLQYKVQNSVMEQHAKNYNLSRQTIMLGRNITRGKSGFEDLDYTKDEIDRIGEILKSDGFSVTPYSGASGNAESLISMSGKSPHILHLATHGFCCTPDEASKIASINGKADAMALSGLVFSGGNAAWLGEKLPDNVLGGVLTSGNIASLDLSGTELVVLSACKSGQGDATPEGLYGLQRAFKKAGAGTMVMTLWNIDDKKTSEFMAIFYKHLVNEEWDKRTAFKNAVTEFRTVNSDPYHWAAFIMLD